MFITNHTVRENPRIDIEQTSFCKKTSKMNKEKGEKGGIYLLAFEIARQYTYRKDVLSIHIL